MVTNEMGFQKIIVAYTCPVTNFCCYQIRCLILFGRALLCGLLGNRRDEIILSNIGATSVFIYYMF